jgi:phosphatidylinositol alpha-1,6-mannosyltransferase
VTGRVLFLTSNYARWPGDSTTPFVHNLAVDLGELGWRVTVLAPHAPGARLREVTDGIEVHRFRYLWPERVETICYGGGALVNIRNSRATLAKVPALVAAEWLATVRLMRTRFDVLHAHWILPQGFIAAAVPRFGAARVVTAHGGDVFGMRGKGIDRFARHALMRADRVTVNSVATEIALRSISGPGTRVTRIPMGADTERSADPEASAGLRAANRRGDGPFLVFVGRVVPEKGVDDIVRAVAALRMQLPDVTAVIVGTGQYLQQVRALAEDQGVADRIAFPGWADPSEVRNWFAAADIVLAPSRIGVDGWQEGQGLTIIEAMSLGRAVIATRTGGITETITDGSTGVLVAPSSPGELARAVLDLHRSPERAQAIAQQAKDSVRSRFSRKASAEQFASLYAEVSLRRSAGGVSSL